MLIKRIVQFLTLILLCLPFWGNAQVTSSSMSGTIKSSTGEILQGASIKVVHIPTGTSYSTQTSKSGGFNLVNMIPGGPYTVRFPTLATRHIRSKI